MFVEQLCIEEIRRVRERYVRGDLRQRMARHHRDPDAAFHGWNDVWLDPDFPAWSILGEIPRIRWPMLLIQGERDRYGTMAQLDAIEQRAAGAVQRVHLDCGHSPPVERLPQTVQAIGQWLDGAAVG